MIKTGVNSMRQPASTHPAHQTYLSCIIHHLIQIGCSIKKLAAALNKTDFVSKCLVVVLIVGIVLAPIALWMGVAFQTRSIVFENAIADQQRVIESLHQYMVNLLKTEALVLDFADRQAGERDCLTLRSDTDIRDFMAVLTQQSAQAKPVRILDAKGDVCLLANQPVPNTIHRGLRDYFSGARETEVGHYYVSRAILGMASGGMVFNVAKARLKNHVFNGVVTISVDVSDMISNWLHMLDVKPTQRLALYRIDGAVIARSWTQVVSKSDELSEHRLGLIWHTTTDGTVVGPIDGTSRVGAWQALPDWGVVITSSVDESEILGPWCRLMTIYWALAALASIISAALAWSLLRGRRLLAKTVTQRTQALWASEDRLRLFINGAPAGIALFDTNMRYLAVSQRYLRDFRLPFTCVEDLIGRAHFDVLNVCAQGQTFYRRALAGETLVGQNGRFMLPNGQIEWVCWEMAPWYELDTTIGGIAVFYEMVTARKQAEIILSRSKEDLENLVTERTGELAHAQARLAHAQRLEALGQLAGGIAHDFNNVLQIVLGAATLVQHCPEDQNRVCNLAGRIIDSAHRGRAITSRLLAFSRQSSLQARPLEVHFFLEGIQEILASTLGTEIVVTVATETDLPLLFADPSQLETVLVNLAINARDAMPQGGTLKLAATAENIRDPYQKGVPLSLADGRYIRLSVQDSGSGMRPDVLARASEPFFTTKKASGGTGLGLAMARGFAEQSGGGFAITSAPGQGSTMDLWFPVAKGPLIQDAPFPRHGALRVRSPGVLAHLLLVDDNKAVLETLVQEMEEEGFAVLAAGDGSEALALLDAGHAVDLVVSDYSMPGMNGVTLIEEAQLRRPLLPAILLTGFVESLAHLAFTSTNRWTLLQKPISSRALVKTINHLLLTRPHVCPKNSSQLTEISYHEIDKR